MLSLRHESDDDLVLRIGWLLSKEIKKLVLVVLSAESRIVRERWEFEVVLLEPEGAAEDGSVCVSPTHP